MYRSALWSVTTFNVPNSEQDTGNTTAISGSRAFPSRLDLVLGPEDETSMDLASRRLLRGSGQPGISPWRACVERTFSWDDVRAIVQIPTLFRATCPAEELRVKLDLTRYIRTAV